MSIDTQPRPHTLETSPPSSRPETSTRQDTLATIRHYSRALVARLFLPNNKTQTPPEPVSESHRAILIDHMHRIMAEEKRVDEINDQEHHSLRYHRAKRVTHALETGQHPDEIRVGIIRKKLAAAVFNFPQVTETPHDYLS